MPTLQTRKIRLKGRSDFTKPGSTLLLCLFFPFYSNGTIFSLLTILHIPASFITHLIREPLHTPLALRDLSIPRLRTPSPALLYFSLGSYHDLQFSSKQPFIECSPCALGLVLCVCYLILFPWDSLKVGIIIFILNARKSRFRDVQWPAQGHQLLSGEKGSVTLVCSVLKPVSWTIMLNFLLATTMFAYPRSLV